MHEGNHSLPPTAEVKEAVEPYFHSSNLFMAWFVFKTERYALWNGRMTTKKRHQLSFIMYVSRSGIQYVYYALHSTIVIKVQS
jgi:hypothetical protein